MSIPMEMASPAIVKPAPIQINHPEPWQWYVLTVALWNDPAFRYFFGERRTARSFLQFMEAVVRGTIESGCGAVFATPDEKAVLVWRWYGADLPEDRKKQIFDAFGPEGTKRYQWFRDASDVPIAESEKNQTMRPNYIGVIPDTQCRGYGSHLLKWTLNHYDQLGFSTPFLVASTPRSAKLYGPLLGFHADRELHLGENNPEYVVIMKRNGGGKPVHF